MNVTFTILEALMIAMIYWVCFCEILPIYIAVASPLFLGFVFGVMFGDVSQGMIIGASLNLYYIGNLTLGGATVQDQALACCIAIPIALRAGLPAETALLIAIPFGVFAGTLDNFRRIAAGRFNSKVNEAIDELNYSKITRWGVIYPELMHFVIRVPLCFFVIYFLGSSVGTVLQNVPNWLSNGISAIGGMLPAMGLILCATNIGQPALIPFFFIGFILMSLTNLPSLAVAIIALFVAIIYVNCSNDYQTLDSSDRIFDIEVEDRSSVLTKRDHWICGWRVYFMHRISNSTEFLYGSSYVVALMPYLKKLYGDNEEGLKEALHRHTLPYMTEQAWGECITGISLAMEEEIANGNTEMTGDQVVTLKSSLMGPLAGLGDTVNWVTLYPIAQSLMIPFALQGQVWPAFWGFVFTILYIGNIYYPVHMLGYNLGKTSVVRLLKSGQLKKFMAVAGVVGMTMMGALSASYMSVTTSLQFVISEGTASEKILILQDILDGVFPNLLAFIYVVAAFFYIQGGKKYLKFVLITMAIGLVGGIIGFF